MGRAPCCAGVGHNRGAWTAQEDFLLSNYIETNGEGQWRDLPKKAGLLRCGKSCRLRWMNYLRPDIKRGNITPDEEELIVRMHKLLGNRWSLIAGRLPGRTDNEIKNFWNTYLCKKLERKGIDPRTHRSLGNKEESTDVVQMEEHSTREAKEVESDSMHVSESHVHLAKANKYIAFPPSSKSISLTSIDIGMGSALDVPEPKLLEPFLDFNSPCSISISNKAEHDSFSWPWNDEEEGTQGSLTPIPNSFTSQPPEEADGGAKCNVWKENNNVPLSYRYLSEEYMELLSQDSNPSNNIRDLISRITVNNEEQDLSVLSDPFSSFWGYLQEYEKLLNQESQNAPDPLSLHQRD